MTYQDSDAEPGARFDPEAAAVRVVGAFAAASRPDRATLLRVAYQNRAPR